MPPYVRTARRADLPALVRLCRAAVGPHDYVLSYLADTLAGREVRVVDDGERIVAMAGITECANGALWLGQLRTHPRFRRRGYATLLLDDAYAKVVRERRPGLRLWTSRRNRIGQALFEGNGFRRIAFNLMRRRNELFVQRRAVCVLWREDEDAALYGAVIAGGRQALLLMRRAAAAMGRERVEVFLPRRSRFIRAARRTGYATAGWGVAAILFERSNRILT